MKESVHIEGMDMLGLLGLLDYLKRKQDYWITPKEDTDRTQRWTEERKGCD